MNGTPPTFVDTTGRPLAKASSTEIGILSTRLGAFASGVPVVSTNVGGVPFIAQDGRNALLVPPSDPQACAAALERVLTDAALAERLARVALEDAETYAWVRVKELWLTEYRRAQSRYVAT